MMVRWATVATMMALTYAPIAAWAATSLSDLPPEQQKRARALLLDAKAAFESGDYEAALTMLDDVYQIYPNPRVLKRLGEAHQSLGNHRLALEHYERFVAEAPEDVNAPEVEGKIAYLRKRLAETSSKLSVQTVPEGARIVVRAVTSEVARGVTPLELKLPEGVYQLEINRDGYETQFEEIRLGYKARVELNYELAEAPLTEPTALNWALVGAGTGLSLAGAGIGLWWLAEDDRIDALSDERRAAVTDAEKTRLTLEIRDVTNENNTRLVFGWVAGGVGVATLVTAWLLWPSDELTMGAAPAPGGGTVFVHGRF